MKENGLDYRLFFEAGADGMLLAKVDGTILDANREACDLLRGTREEVLAARREGLFDPSHPLLRPAFEKLRETGRFESELKLRRRDGTAFPAEVSMTVYGDEKAGIVFRDITERKQKEENPHLSEGQFKALVESSLDWISICNPDNTFCYLSPSTKDILGYEPEELVGTVSSDLVHPDDLARAAKAYVKDTNTPGPVTREFRYRHKDGSYRYLEGSANVLVEDPSVQGVVVNLRDVTDRKLAEEALRQSEKRLARLNEELARSNAELEQFAYVASHGLRSPLRSMAGFSQILLEDHAHRLDAEGKDYLERLRSSSRHMEQLVEDILNLSRATYQPLQRGPVDLSTIARGIAAERKEDRPEREVEFVIERGLTAEGDPGLLRMALENVIGNAWKYTHKRPRARIEFGAVEYDGTRAYYVRDDGVGFDMAQAEGLFEPFRRLHRPHEFEGTGIGLATVERIVHRHGGKVWAEGEVGKGATFYFTLGPDGGSGEHPAPGDAG